MYKYYVQIFMLTYVYKNKMRIKKFDKIYTNLIMYVYHTIEGKELLWKYYRRVSWEFRRFCLRFTLTFMLIYIIEEQDGNWEEDAEDPCWENQQLSPPPYTEVVQKHVLNVRV